MRRRHAFIVRDIPHAQRGVLAEARVDVMRARKNSQKARIRGRLVGDALHQHAHLAADALERDGR